MSHVTPGGAKLRLSGSVDTDFKTTVTSMVDATGTGKFTLVGQAIRKRFDGGLLPASWGATGTVRGGDYTACVRAKDGPELGASYNQRLAPGSRLTLGGEVLLSVPTLAAMLAPAPAVGGRGLAPPSAGKPVEWSVGAAYDGDLTKVRARASNAAGAPVPRHARAGRACARHRAWRRGRPSARAGRSRCLARRCCEAVLTCPPPPSPRGAPRRARAVGAPRRFHGPAQPHRERAPRVQGHRSGVVGGQGDPRHGQPQLNGACALTRAPGRRLQEWRPSVG